MRDLEKARVLVEALPYIRMHSGKTIVVKLGGSTMEDEKIWKSAIRDIALLKYVGINPVLVHGGGKRINHYLEKLSIQARFVEGERVTDKETMKVVKMVLLGLINKDLVNQLNIEGCQAIGISGEDGGLVQARQRKESNLGLVGEVEKVNPEIIKRLINEDYLPVVASIGRSRDGLSLNINADLVAGAVAAALRADKLIFLTDVDGLYAVDSKKRELISEIDLKGLKMFLKTNRDMGGMLPKLKGAVEALEGGVSRVHILNGAKPHSLILELFTKPGVGTMIKP